MSGRLAADESHALPPGVDWTPVDDALRALRDGLSCVAGVETVDLGSAEGRFLAGKVTARRSNPAAANSAIDGYGFAHDSLGEGDECRLELAPGRAAAGHPHESGLEPGHAVRILTGAILPPGVDTVVLEESTRIDNGHVCFRKPRRSGQNTRLAGEDFSEGDLLLDAGTRLNAARIGHLAAAGADRVAVRSTLRIGILSTGEELRRVGREMAPHHVPDCNRPMLLALVGRLGFHPVDLGMAGDDPDDIRRRLDSCSGQVDAIITSGGVSTGDEDHVSSLLSDEASLNIWRIAVKPGRPLALAIRKGVPVFGLPGNPVAAFVCSLIFVLPALRQLAGGGWLEPRGYAVPAAFAKQKKAGRREFIRARLNPKGEAEAFESEGSGLTTGLAWSDGLVELEDARQQVGRGEQVRYIPYASFGL